MSLPLASVKENLSMIESRLLKVGGEQARKGFEVRLRKIGSIIAENETKIWLRTKVGQPMVKSLSDSVEALLKLLEDPSLSVERVEAALVEVEKQVGKLDEESRRRSMVVT